MEAARLATADDLDDIETVVKLHVSTLHEQRGGTMYLRREAGATPLREKLVAGFDDPNVRVIAGTFDDVVFGYGYLVLETMPGGGILARLDDFLVQEEARGVGIGAAMMDLALEMAADAGCVGIDSRALPGDRHTKNFFESYGLKARMLTVHLTLDGETSA